MKIADIILREGPFVWGTLRVVNERGQTIRIEGQKEGSDVWIPVVTFVSLQGRLAYTVYSKTGTARLTGEVENASHDPERPGGLIIPTSW